MKKSILAVGAVAVLGGLGLSGAANAAAVFNSDGTADTLALNPGGVGHILTVPYYSAQASNSTLFSIVNTDTQNGKAVKVRFRGAANSDDVLDFTLYLSPGDVWSAGVARNNGIAHLETSDNSCTDPLKEEWVDLDGKGKYGVDFSTIRLDPKLSAEQQALNAGEGYIEILNMADIPNEPGNALYRAIKHDKNGVPPCVADDWAKGVIEQVRRTDSNADIYDLGAAGNRQWIDVGLAGDEGAVLANPTGGLMGSWAILNQQELYSVSGDMGAIVATVEGEVGADGVTPLAADASMVFFPQLDEETFTVDVSELTADPLLTGANPHIDPLWFDLPDLSTPLVGRDAADQADHLSTALSRTSFYNEYVTGASYGGMTDWVVSQPTRRYHAAVNYAAGGNNIVYRGEQKENIYGNLTLIDGQACHTFGLTTWDREENQARTSVGGGFSPGVAKRDPMCGEVFVVSFNNSNSMLNATVTHRSHTAVGESGWGRFATPDGTRLPMIGYSAMRIGNAAAGVTYGWTLQHRWDN